MADIPVHVPMPSVSGTCLISKAHGGPATRRGPRTASADSTTRPVDTDQAVGPCGGARLPSRSGEVRPWQAQRARVWLIAVCRARRVAGGKGLP